VTATTLMAPTAWPRARRRLVGIVVTRFTAGAGGVALRGAQVLDAARFESVIVTGSADARLVKQAKDAGIEVRMLASLVPEIAPHTDLAALRELTAMCRRDGFDVVHTHSAKAGTLGRLAAASAGVRRIVHTLHGFPFHEFQSGLRRNAYVAVERRLARYTDVFLAVGTGVAAEAVRRGIAPPDRLRTIAPPIESAMAPADPTRRRRAREMLGLSHEARVIGTVGRLDYQKAPEHFVEAMSRLPDDVQGVWVGDGPLRGKIEHLLRGKQLEGRLRLLGNRTDVPDILPAFDVFVMASRYEGLPCAIAEAMSVGIPVVATAVNAVPDLVVAGETGLLVQPARPRALATAVSHLLEHPDTARRLAERGGAALGERFTATALEPVLVEAYTENVATRPRVNGIRHRRPGHLVPRT